MWLRSIADAVKKLEYQPRFFVPGGSEFGVNEIIVEISDIVYNTLGGMLGGVVYITVKKVHEKVPK